MPHAIANCRPFVVRYTARSSREYAHNPPAALWIAFRYSPGQLVDRFRDALPGLRLLLSPGKGVAALHQVATGAQALLTLSGPEGGLSPAEENAALAHGFVRAGLGERVLRAETAPLAVLAWAGLKES